jgi:GTPase
MNPVVTIIGRPNVGKSTLFNTIARRNIAIVHDLAGVTRDRNYTDVTIDSHCFTLIDTGGFDPAGEDDFARLVREQAAFAVEEADLIIFLMDGTDGLLHSDIDIARTLQLSNKPVLYAVNKVEGRKIHDGMSEFYRIGADMLYPVSALHKTGIPELVDAIRANIPEGKPFKPADNEIVCSIIGRPNVGKSSLINRLIGQDRFMVSERAGTTRDPVDTLMRYHDQTIRFIDTAGIRRKSSLGYKLERYCELMSLKSITRSDICILIIDASDGVTAYDARLAAHIYERNRACILAVNKWDLVEKQDKSYEHFIRDVKARLAFLDFAPVVAMSALTGQRVRRILDMILEIGARYRHRITTAEVNRAIEEVCAHHPPPGAGNRRTKIYYITQVATAPPVFKLFTNNPQVFTKSYTRYLERSLRERLDMGSIPLCLQVTGREKKDTPDRKPSARRNKIR